MKSFMLGFIGGVASLLVLAAIFGDDSVFYRNGQMSIRKEAFKNHHMIKEVDEHDNVIYKWTTSTTSTFR